VGCNKGQLNNRTLGDRVPRISLNHPNFLFAKSGPQTGNNSTMVGAPQFGFETAAHDPRQIQLGL
jgi:hypothetical protein